MLKKSFATLLFSLFSIPVVFAQSYPQNYFRNPLNIPLQLVANFGEIRTNHWHMGLDIRTQQKVNLPVFAAAEGFVSRVVVEPGGFGQAIYIDHPNGYTTLYAHLNAFFPALEQYVRKMQYQLESWKVSLVIPPGMFPVNRGDFIARSGSTGGSEGPHVHFEIRDTKTENCLNPLLFSFPIADAVPPSISRLALYDRNKSTYLQPPQLLSLRKAGGLYSIPSGLVRVGTDRISFAVGAVDRFSNTPNPNGIFSARMLVDGTEVSGFSLDNISYTDTRYINAQLDFPYKARGGGSLQHLTPLPGAQTVPYRMAGNDGVLHLRDEAPHEVEIDVRDAKGNISRIHFRVQYDPALRPSYSTPAEKLLPGNVNIFEQDDFELFTSERTLYDTAVVQFERDAKPVTDAVSPLFRFLGNAIPAHDSFTVRIRAANVPAEWRDRVVIRNVSGSRTFLQKAVWQNGWFSARFRQFGTFQAFVDQEPPAINAPATNLSRATRIVIVPKDNFKSIRYFRAEVDGQWLRFTNDKGLSWVYTFDDHFPKGTHELKVVVEDEAGNRTTKSWTVTR